MKNQKPELGDRHRNEPGFMQFVCSIRKDTFNSPEYADVDIDKAIREHDALESISKAAEPLRLAVNALLATLCDEDFPLRLKVLKIQVELEKSQSKLAEIRGQ